MTMSTTTTISTMVTAALTSGGIDVTWALDNVELTTVGVDVGSSTSHLLFAKLHLQRLTQSLS